VVVYMALGTSGGSVVNRRGGLVPAAGTSRGHAPGHNSYLRSLGIPFHSGLGVEVESA